MTQIRNYPKDFVTRTIELLDKLERPAVDAGLEVTFFLNCLLGLIVTTLESIDKLESGQCNKSIFKVKLNDKEIKEIIPKKIKAIKDKEFYNKYKKQINESEFLKNFDKKEIIIDSFSIPFLTKNEMMDRELVWFIRKLRHGIAHQNIMPINSSKRWEGVCIWTNNSNGIINFAVEFSIEELRNFSKMVAKRYLEII